MLGDILYINDLHEAAAEAIAKRVLSEKGKMPKSYKFILGISGEAGVGKSEISHSIALQLRKEHIRVKVIHTGNYYKIPPLLMTEWRKTKGIESVGMSEYDWNLLSMNIQDFKEDRESMMPCIDVVPEQMDKLITDFKKIDFLIISGLYAIKADGIDLRVYVEIDYHDLNTGKNTQKKESKDEFKLKVLEKEHNNVISLKHLADLIINKGYQVIDAKTGESLME
jgi:uridine kinase